MDESMYNRNLTSHIMAGHVLVCGVIIPTDD